MAVVYSSAALNAGEVGGQPLRHPRVGSQDYYASGTITASSEATDYPAVNVGDGLDWDWWEPTSLPAWVEVDAGSAVNVTYMGVAAHDFGTQGITATPQYSTDGGSTWNDAAPSESPSDDAPILWLFTSTSARYWRLYLEGSNIPKVPVAQVGDALHWARPIYQGHSPMPLSRQTDIRPNRAESGSRLGRSIIRRGNATSFSFENLPYDFVRDEVDPFIKRARTRPFFIAWRPTKAPDDVGWGWTNDDIVPENSGPRDLMSVSFDVVGIAYGDS